MGYVSLFNLYLIDWLNNLDKSKQIKCTIIINSRMCKLRHQRSKCELFMIVSLWSSRLEGPVSSVPSPIYRCIRGPNSTKSDNWAIWWAVKMTCCSTVAKLCTTPRFHPIIRWCVPCNKHSMIQNFCREDRAGDQLRPCSTVSNDRKCLVRSRHFDITFEKINDLMTSNYHLKTRCSRCFIMFKIWLSKMSLVMGWAPESSWILATTHQ